MSWLHSFEVTIGDRWTSCTWCCTMVTAVLAAAALSLPLTVTRERVQVGAVIADVLKRKKAQAAVIVNIEK